VTESGAAMSAANIDRRPLSRLEVSAMHAVHTIVGSMPSVPPMADCPPAPGKNIWSSAAQGATASTRSPRAALQTAIDTSKSGRRAPHFGRYLGGCNRAVPPTTGSPGVRAKS